MSRKKYIAMYCSVWQHNNMSYKENQKSPIVQKQDGKKRRITGLWQRTVTFENKTRIYLKSGRINREGWENLAAFGDRTILLITKGKKRGGIGRPNFILWAIEDNYS